MKMTHKILAFVSFIIAVMGMLIARITDVMLIMLPFLWIILVLSGIWFTIGCFVDRFLEMNE